jgi:hypothetical protein
MGSGRARRAWRGRHSGYRIGQWADRGDFAVGVGRCPLRQCWNHDGSRLLVDSEISIIEEYCVLEPPVYLLLYADVDQILSFFDAAQISVNNVYDPWPLPCFRRRVNNTWLRVINLPQVGTFPGIASDESFNGSRQFHNFASFILQEMKQSESYRLIRNHAVIIQVHSLNRVSLTNTDVLTDPLGNITHFVVMGHRVETRRRAVG